MNWKGEPDNEGGFRSSLRIAKERLTIRALWAIFRLLGRPGKSCCSSFREDCKASLGAPSLR
jgi:hypothetical protein